MTSKAQVERKAAADYLRAMAGKTGLKDVKRWLKCMAGDLERGIHVEDEVKQWVAEGHMRQYYGRP